MKKKIDRGILHSKTFLLLLLVELATLITTAFWGLYFQAPSIVKFIFSVSIWSTVVFFPFAFIKKNDFGKIANYIIFVILLLGIFAILRSCFNFEAALYAFGNKWLTLFLNEYCALLFVPPLFSYIATNIRSLFYLKLLISLYLVLCFPFFNYSSQNLFFVVIVLAPFFLYLNYFFRILVFIVIVKALFFSFWGLNPTRAMILYVAFSVLAYMLAYVFEKDIIKKILIVVTLLAIFFYYIPLLNNTDEGIFVKLQDYMLSHNESSELSTDTRTFLYQELSEDLQNTKSFIFGKGAFAYYYSFYFDSGVNGRYGRMASEVTFLNWLLHGGLIYVVLYYFLMFYAVIKAIMYGKNRFVKCIAVVIIGWIFNSFICDMNGARFYHVVFFVLLGCCLSKRWLNYSDRQVQYIMSGSFFRNRKSLIVKKKV